MRGKQTVVRPGATWGHFGAVPPNHCSCPPKQELCPPSEDCAPKKLTGSVLLESNSRPKTPKILVITPEFVGKNCFFIDFAIKTVCFCGFTPEFTKTHVYCGIKTSFFGFYVFFEMKTLFFLVFT